MMSRGVATAVSIEKNASDRSSRFNRIVSIGDSGTVGSWILHRDGILGYASTRRACRSSGAGKISVSQRGAAGVVRA
jgi:hypothetical protein